MPLWNNPILTHRSMMSFFLLNSTVFLGVAADSLSKGREELNQCRLHPPALELLDFQTAMSNIGASLLRATYFLSVPHFS